MKVALFFGSFNPIHIGHLAIANYVAEYGGVDKVLMVVSPLNPLKQNRGMLPETIRKGYIDKALDGYERISATDVEFTLPRPSYTYTTLCHLRSIHRDCEFVLVIGADNVETFDKWRDSEKILSEFEVWVYPRRGYVEQIPTKYERRMKWIDAPMIEVSSTFLRNSIIQGKDVRYFFPSVALYKDVCEEVKTMYEAEKELTNEK